MNADTGLPLLELPDRAALRAWLAANHATSSGVHLAVGNKGSASSRLTYEDAILEALAFGWIDSTSHALDADRHTVMFVPRRPGGTWARTNKARITALIGDGLMTPAGLAVIEAAQTDGSWNSLDDVEDLVVPGDLAAALAAEPDAASAWEATTESRRKMSLFRIASAKRPETRAKRIAEVVRVAAEARRIP